METTFQKNENKGVFSLKKNKKKSVRKWLWVFLIFLLLLLIAATAVTATFYHYRKEEEDAFLYSEQYTEDELKQKHRDLNFEVHDTLKAKLPEANMDILNERDRRKLSGGDLSPEQTAEIFREARKRAGIPDPHESSQDGTALPLESSSQTSPDSNSTASPGQKPVSYRSVDTLIEEFYILKARYVSSLDGILRQCKTEWRSKPKEERTFSARLVMAEKCMSMGNALEVECDAEMEALIEELRASLVASGQSTAIISEIRATYEEEKRLKKAALIDRYYPS